MSSPGTPAVDPAAPPATSPATPPTPPSTNWFDGADADTLGYLQNRGWDKLDAKTAAFNAAKAHREAEKLIGVPADKIVRLPKDANDAEGWSKLRTQLGVPADAKGYDFSAVKFADGTALDDEFTGTLSAALLKSDVAKDKAPEIAQAIVKFMESAEGATSGEEAAALATQKDALKANWGNNYNANLIVAQNAFRALGVETAAVQALEKVVGYDKVMDLFRNIGSRIGEDSFVRSTAPGNTGGPMTREQATATLDERLRDTIWTGKLNAGDSSTVREFDNLTRLMQ